MGFHCVVSAAGVVVYEGQFHGPVMGQVERAPGGVVETGLRKFEVAGLAEVALAVTEAEVFGRIAAIAESELPSEVEEELLTGSNGGNGRYGSFGRFCREQCGGSSEGGIGSERGGGENEPGREQIAARDEGHRSLDEQRR
jgi:hypothetical protein